MLETMQRAQGEQLRTSLKLKKTRLKEKKEISSSRENRGAKEIMQFRKSFRFQEIDQSAFNKSEKRFAAMEK